MMAYQLMQFAKCLQGITRSTFCFNPIEPLNPYCMLSANPPQRASV
jgi:hypothetical protein